MANAYSQGSGKTLELSWTHFLLSPESLISTFETHQTPDYFSLLLSPIQATVIFTWLIIIASCACPLFLYLPVVCTYRTGMGSNNLEV